jgi:hypothetical protein
MRVAVIVAMLSLVFPTLAKASWCSGYGPDRVAYAGYHHRVAYAGHRVANAGNCAVAARKGGPCGCTAMKNAGIDASRVRYWLVANWRRDFPQTTCHAGAAALWSQPREHVEIVKECDGPKVVTIGPYGLRTTPKRILSFVEPHADLSASASHSGVLDGDAIAGP